MRCGLNRNINGIIHNCVKEKNHIGDHETSNGVSWSFVSQCKSMIEIDGHYIRCKKIRHHNDEHESVDGKKWAKNQCLCVRTIGQIQFKCSKNAGHSGNHTTFEGVEWIPLAKRPPLCQNSIIINGIRCFCSKPVKHEGNHSDSKHNWLTRSQLREKPACTYCGRKVRSKGMTVDHIFPRSKGGTNDANNLVPVCKHCNSDKASLLLEDYFLLNLRRVFYIILFIGFFDCLKILGRKLWFRLKRNIRFWKKRFKNLFKIVKKLTNH